VLVWLRRPRLIAAVSTRSGARCRSARKQLWGDSWLDHSPPDSACSLLAHLACLLDRPAPASGRGRGSNGAETSATAFGFANAVPVATARLLLEPHDVVLDVCEDREPTIYDCAVGRIEREVHDRAGLDVTEIAVLAEPQEPAGEQRDALGSEPRGEVGGSEEFAHLDARIAEIEGTDSIRRPDLARSGSRFPDSAPRALDKEAQIRYVRATSARSPLVQ
jgi:hypothetical protein